MEKAIALHRAGQLDEAETLYRQIVDTAPADAEALHYLGVIAHQRGRHQDAVEMLESALRIGPVRAHYYANLASVRMGQGRTEDAVACYRNAIELSPSFVPALASLGNILWSQGKKEQAAEYFRSVLELEPEHPTASHLLAAARGEHRERAPVEYVREVFDGYSERFDEHLVNELGYRVPEILEAAVARAAPAGRSGWNVLDLGCGTGLCGALFRDVSAHLVGVDLSPKMLDVARAKNVYDELRLGDLRDELLLGDEAHWNVVLAADVFIYVGELHQVFSAARRALRTDGLFVFSTETSDTRAVVLGGGGRFAHSQSYVESLARRNGFAVVRCDDIHVRKERDGVLPGQVFVLGASGRERQTEPLGATKIALTPRALLKQAIELHRQERLDEAETMYRRVLERDPENGHARRFLAVIMNGHARP